MSNGDFSIPPDVNMSPQPVDFSGLRSATAQAQGARSDAMNRLAEAGKMLYTIGQDASFANMQTDILHMKMEVTQKAIDLVAQGPGKGFDYVPDESGNNVIQLGDDFQKTIDAYQETLTEKYKSYPAVQRAALESFDSTVLEAHKAAYAAATKTALEDGKLGIVNSITLATKAGIQSRSTALVDAILDNPKTTRFYPPSEIESMRIKAHQAVNDGVFSSDLNADVKTSGVAAALERLNARTDLLPQQRDAYYNDVLRAEAAEQGAANKAALEKATALVGQGSSVYDAVNQATEGMPDFRAAAAQETVSAYLNGRQIQFDKAAVAKVDVYAMGDGVTPGKGWSATEVWYTNPDTMKELGMSGTEWQSELEYIQRRVREEGDPSSPKVANTIPRPLMDTLSNFQLGSEAKDAIFKKAYGKDGWTDPETKAVVKISAAQLDWLRSHHIQDDQSYSQYLGAIGTLGKSDPTTGAPPAIPPEQAIAAQMQFAQEYDRLNSRSSGPATFAEIQKAYSDIREYYLDANLNASVKQAFSRTGVLSIFDPNNIGQVNAMQTRIQSGQIATMAGLSSFQSNLDALRTAQLRLLAPKMKAGAFTVTEAVQAANGQQFFHDDKGRTIAYIVTSGGNGKWVYATTGSEPEAFSAWKDLK